jgi:hypothetical protein
MNAYLKAAALIIGAIILSGTMASPKYGDGAAWDDLRFPASRFQLGAARPPALVVWATDGAGSQGVLALEFADEPVNEEQVFFDAQMPHGWREGSQLDVHIHYSPEDTTVCNYRMCVEYMVASIGSNFPANTTVTCVDFASSAIATKHSLVDLIDITMTGETISAVVKGRLVRNSAHVNDTCNGKKLYLHTFDIHHELDRPGSRSELSK